MAYSTYKNVLEPLKVTHSALIRVIMKHVYNSESLIDTLFQKFHKYINIETVIQ